MSELECQSIARVGPTITHAVSPARRLGSRPWRAFQWVPIASLSISIVAMTYGSDTSTKGWPIQGS